MCKASLLAFGLLASLLAWTPAWAAYQGTPPQIVSDGGTGATTFTAHGVVVGEGVGAMVAVSPVADSVLVYGSASSDPTLAGTGSTADSVLGWGAAGAAPAPEALTSCSAATNAVTYNTSTHAWGCNTLSTGGVALSTAAVASTATITIAATNGLTSIINTGTAATTIALPTAVAGNGFRLCVKDGTENFSTNPAKVTSPTAGNIDGTTGSTGISNFFNQAKMEACFISDNANWYVE